MATFINWPLIEIETQLLQQLDPETLRVATEADLAVGAVLFYKLSAVDWGCHTLRSEGYRKDEHGNMVSDIRGGVKAGKFYVKQMP